MRHIPAELRPEALQQLPPRKKRQSQPASAGPGGRVAAGAGGDTHCEGGRGMLGGSGYRGGSLSRLSDTTTVIHLEDEGEEEMDKGKKEGGGRVRVSGEGLSLAPSVLLPHETSLLPLSALRDLLVGWAPPPPSVTVSQLEFTGNRVDADDDDADDDADGDDVADCDVDSDEDGGCLSFPPDPTPAGGGHRSQMELSSSRKQALCSYAIFLVHSQQLDKVSGRPS